MELNIRVAVWPFMETEKEEEKQATIQCTIKYTHTVARARAHISVEIYAKVEHIIRPHHLLTESRENEKNNPGEATN